MRALRFASLVTLALSVFAGCAVENGQPDQTTDETKTTEGALSRPWPLNIQFGIIGFAGGCFRGPGICSIGTSPTWDLYNALGTFDQKETLSLSLTAKSIPFSLADGLKITAPVALDGKNLEIQPGTYYVKSSTSTSVVVDVRVAPVWANASNPHDWVGKLHNKAMAYGRGVLPTGASPDSVDATVTKFLASEGITLDTTKFFSSGVNKLAAELFASSTPGDLLVKTGKLSDRGAAYYGRILDASLNYALKGDYGTSKKIELEIMSDKSLTAQESDSLLVTASVGRYSAAYVLSSGAPEAQQHPIVKADVSGAIGGAVSGAIGGAVVVPVVGSVPGWIAGGVLGGVGASLGEWVSSWF